MRIYKILALIFGLYRQYCFPNPFDVLGDEIVLSVGSGSILLSPDLLNLIVEPIVFKITYEVVGLYYETRTCPALGSILYMMFYCIHMAGIYFILSLYPMKWLMILVVGVYVAIHILALKCKSRLSYV